MCIVSGCPVNRKRIDIFDPQPLGPRESHWCQNYMIRKKLLRAKTTTSLAYLRIKSNLLSASTRLGEHSKNPQPTALAPLRPRIQMTSTVYETTHGNHPVRPVPTSLAKYVQHMQNTYKRSLSSLVWDLTARQESLMDLTQKQSILASLREQQDSLNTGTGAIAT